MYGTKGRDAYLETRVLSATPEQLVVILYDFLLTQLQRVRLATEAGNGEMRLAALDRSRKAVSELLLTLDTQKGGTIATQLDALYNFMFRELLDLGLKPDLARLERVVAMVQQLRDAFDEAARRRPLDTPLS